MTFDNIKRLWREENVASLQSQPLPPSLADQARQRGVAMRRTIAQRDWMETLAAVVVIAIFGPLAYFVPSRTAQAGALLIVVGAVITIVVLHRARRYAGDRHVDQSVRDCCESELTAVVRQIRILQSVLWWYIAPLLGGAALFFAGQVRWGLATYVAWIVFTVIGAWIYRLNQRAVTQTLIPLRDELISVLADLDKTTSEP